MTSWTPALAADGKPRYLQIADAIEADVRSGGLRPGDRLPPQRRLAERLGIDFTTVSRAYAEAQARQLVQSHVGRGTFIRGSQAAPAARPDPRRLVAEDLSMNRPPEIDDAELIGHMRDGLAQISADLMPLLRYQATTGGEPDKAAAAVWLARRGIAAAPERIAIAPGAHAAMAAILSTLARAGDTVLCERVTYPGLRALAARLGLRLVGIGLDDAGVIPELLEVAIRDHAPKALYLNPVLHNPTTLTMPDWRRRELAAILTRHGLPLVEDDAYGFVPEAPPPAFAALAPGLTWHVGGLSKCIGAGLRLAYVVAPEGRAAFALAQALRALAGMASPLGMALATRWIEDGTADRIRAHLCHETAARQRIAAQVLAGLQFRADPCAFNIWLKLPEGAGRAELMGRMAGRQIGLMPADAFTVGAAPDEHLRICLGGAIGRDALQEGLMFSADSLSGGGWMG
ncbi:MAG: PLP-dependent aminotransferase family protein [Paracoccus aminovorans]|nr:PLP-dependent aminotransferase family protein [Paracoccus aminovorans]